MTVYTRSSIYTYLYGNERHELYYIYDNQVCVHLCRPAGSISLGAAQLSATSNGIVAQLPTSLIGPSVSMTRLLRSPDLIERNPVSTDTSFLDVDIQFYIDDFYILFDWWYNIRKIIKLRSNVSPVAMVNVIIWILYERWFCRETLNHIERKAFCFSFVCGLTLIIKMMIIS
jgi:hypothetical protein